MDSATQRGKVLINATNEVEQIAEKAKDCASLALQGGNFFLSLLKKYRQDKAAEVFAKLERYYEETIGNESKKTKISVKESPVDFYVNHWEKQVGHNSLRQICRRLCAEINNITIDIYDKSNNATGYLKSKIFGEDIKKTPLLILLMMIKDELFLLSDGNLDNDKLDQLIHLKNFTIKIQKDKELLKKLTEQDGLLLNMLFNISTALDKRVQPVIAKEIGLANSVRNFEALLEKSFVLVEQGILCLFYLISKKDYKYNLTPDKFYDKDSDKIFGSAKNTLPVCIIKFLLQQSHFAAIFPPMEWDDDALKEENIEISMDEKLTDHLLTDIKNAYNPFMVSEGDLHVGAMPKWVATQFTGKENNEWKFLIDFLNKNSSHLPAEFQNEDFLKSYFKSFGLLYQLCIIRTGFYHMRKIAMEGGNLFSYHAANDIINGIVEFYESSVNSLFKEFSILFNSAEKINGKYNKYKGNEKNNPPSEQKNYIRDMNEWIENYNTAENCYKTCTESKDACSRIMTDIHHYLSKNSTINVLSEILAEYSALKDTLTYALAMSKRSGLIDKKSLVTLQTLQNNTGLTLFPDVRHSSDSAQIASSSCSSSTNSFSLFGASSVLQNKQPATESDLQNAKIVMKRLETLMNKPEEFLELYHQVFHSKQFNDCYSDEDQVKILFIYARELAACDDWNEAGKQLGIILKRDPRHKDATKLLSQIKPVIAKNAI